MAKGLFAKIAKGVLSVAGAVTGMFAPPLGAAIMAAGMAVPINTPTGSADVVSEASKAVEETVQRSRAMTAASRTVGTTDSVMAWIRQYWMYVVGGLAAIFLLPKLLKGGRR